MRYKNASFMAWSEFSLQRGVKQTWQCILGNLAGAATAEKTSLSAQSLVQPRAACSVCFKALRWYVPMKDPVLHIRLKKQLSGGRVPHLLQMRTERRLSTSSVMSEPDP